MTVLELDEFRIPALRQPYLEKAVVVSLGDFFDLHSGESLNDLRNGIAVARDYDRSRPSGSSDSSDQLFDFAGSNRLDRDAVCHGQRLQGLPRSSILGCEETNDPGPFQQMRQCQSSGPAGRRQLWISILGCFLRVTDNVHDLGRLCLHAGTDQAQTRPATHR